MKAQVQRLGGFMAGMVIPNIGAFIAWGLITSLFIPPGWLAKWFGEDSLDYQFITDNTVGPMIKYLLPLLIAYTGGKMIYGHRGGVLGAIAVMGVIGGSAFEITSGAFAGASGEPPQFLGAMVVGPMSGWLMKKVDAFLEPRTPAGFEMLYNNFSQGILGLVLAMIGFWAIGPVMAAIAIVFGAILKSIADSGLLPLMDIPIEVGKVLFLNNAINHGILTPLGAAEAAETGKSIYFLLETNPGPGLGLLGSYWFAGKGLAKLSAPGAIIIHFFGGIHEVYFPFVLMNPVMIVAMWAGGITADITFVATNAGLSASPAPGSIFAYLALLPAGGGGVGALLGVAVGAVAAFVVGAILLRLFPVKDMDDTAVEDGAMHDVPHIPLGAEG